MARPIWSGVISFGLVSIPVGLYTATKEHEVSFHQFQRGTGDRIRYQRVNERTGKEVEFGEIVKGAEVGDSRYVMIDSDELDAIAPGRSRSLDIHTFVDRTEIDPVYFQKTYYLGPSSPEAAKAYALMRDALADSNRVAIGTLVMRGKEYLTAIRSDQDVLVLETMFFADEVREPKEQLDGVPARAKAKPQELAMAMQLIDSMAGSWRPDDYRDTYTDRVKDLISAKKKGEEVTVAEAAPEATNVVDLMSALQASVEAAKQGRPSRRSSTGPRKPPSKSASAKAPAKATSAKAPAKAAAKRTTTAPAKKARKAS
jgi:DNA end-binding protein Ku